MKVEDELSKLHSSKSTLRLEQIARLRARGIGEHVDLPQLVVCGDQSAGKSSVLEGITGLPFPRQDGVCTKFATEIILQHSTGEYYIVATILPSSSRPNSSRDELRAYRRVLKDFNELPIAIEEVGTLLGLRGFGHIDDGPAFAEDVITDCYRRRMSKGDFLLRSNALDTGQGHTRPRINCILDLPARDWQDGEVWRVADNASKTFGEQVIDRYG